MTYETIDKRIYDTKKNYCELKDASELYPGGYGSIKNDILISKFSGAMTVVMGVATFSAYQNDSELISPYILGTVISVLANAYFYSRSKKNKSNCDSCISKK